MKFFSFKLLLFESRKSILDELRTGANSVKLLSGLPNLALIDPTKMLDLDM